MKTPSPPPSPSEVDIGSVSSVFPGIPVENNLNVAVPDVNSEIENPIPAPFSAGIGGTSHPQDPNLLFEREVEDPSSSFSRKDIESPSFNSNFKENFQVEKGEDVADSEAVVSRIDGDSGVGSANLRKAPFSLWNAVVRGPMRRLQERLLGSRWGSAGTEITKSSIWLLGVCYALGEDADVASTEAYTEFLVDYSSRIWLTYRKGFEALGPAKMTSDVNWGCMLRSGQMLLAQALVCHHLGRHWRRKSSESNAKEYLKILQCFGDSPSQECPFSIHNILEVGAPYGLVAGSWLGPYALCRSFEALAQTVRETSNEKFQCKLPMEVYVVSGDADGERGGAPCICIDDVESLCLRKDTWTPVLLLVPLVLGLDKVNSRYLPSLWATFSFPQSLGILGGKPGASTYLVGVQGDQTFYLDPHEVQQVLIMSPENEEADSNSYHCSVVKKMPLNAIDPSLALGFYCVDQGDFEDLCKRASELEKDSNGAPMFTVVKHSKKDSIPREEFEGPVSSDEPEEDWQIL
ncbi:hypothetical protein GOP47_0029907 [Adiantum capillus-veneris]|nr:hypothetical protein GOP47_0029907 [Adiantum capillus-veneris]